MNTDAVAHRIEVEGPKSASEKGKYQYPELFDQLESRAVILRSQPLLSTGQPVSIQREESTPDAVALPKT